MHFEKEWFSSHNNKHVWNKNTPKQHQVPIALFSFYNYLNIFTEIMKMQIHKYINVIQYHYISMFKTHVMIFQSHEKSKITIF
jgi:hypothetical protein